MQVYSIGRKANHVKISFNLTDLILIPKLPAHRGLNFLKLMYGIKIKSNYLIALSKKGLMLLIVVDKSTNKIQFRQMEKTIQKNFNNQYRLR